jgi:hypothetical protein
MSTKNKNINYAEEMYSKKKGERSFFLFIMIEKNSAFFNAHFYLFLKLCQHDIIATKKERDTHIHDTLNLTYFSRAPKINNQYLYREYYSSQQKIVINIVIT